MKYKYKKIICLLMIVCAPLMFFTACGKHTHEWTTTWSFNSTEHWLTCDSCDAKKDMSKHIFIVKTINPTCANKGYKIHTCQICKYSYEDSFVEKTNTHSGIGSCGICKLNYFNELTSFMIKNATYVQSSNFYGWTVTESPFEILWVYKPNLKQVEVSFTKKTSSVNLFFITYYNDSNGYYKWAMDYQIVSSGVSYQMEGTLSAQSLTDSTYYLSYDKSTFSDSLRDEARHLAATSYRSNVGFFQSVLDMYNSKSRYWGYTNLSLGGLLP